MNNITGENGMYGRDARPQKGKSLLKVVDDYIAIDIETTGLNPGQCEIIELGAQRYEEGTPTQSFSMLIRPSRSISRFITNLTGITNEMVEGAPPITEALPAFLSFVEGSILLGHNVNFDINFIYDNCIRHLHAPFPNDFIDTMRFSRRLFSELENHKLVTLVNSFGICEVTAHRALADAQVTAQCYEHMKAHMKANGITSLSPASYKNWIKSKDIVPSTDVFDESHPFYGKRCIITGTLRNFSRKEALQQIADCGGIIGDSITKNTHYLILGANEKDIPGYKSTKQKRAEKLASEGFNIKIISEEEFCALLNR